MKFHPSLNNMARGLMRGTPDKHTQRLLDRGAWRYSSLCQFPSESIEQTALRLARDLREWRAHRRRDHNVPQRWSRLSTVAPLNRSDVAYEIALSRGVSMVSALALSKLAAKTGRMFSVEMEFVARPMSPLADLSFDFRTGWNRNVEFCRDGSVSSGGGFMPARLQECKVTCEVGRVASLYDTCKKLQEAGGGVNSSCGLHVHLDARHLTRTQEATRRRHLIGALPWLLELVPQSRRMNDYCWPNYMANPPMRAKRYRAINPTSYARHQTTEVRLGSASIDADKVVNWVMLLHWLYESVKYYRTFDSFLKSDAPQYLKVWAVIRRAKFAGTVDSNEASEVEALAHV